MRSSILILAIATTNVPALESPIPLEAKNSWANSSTFENGEVVIDRTLARTKGGATEKSESKTVCKKSANSSLIEYHIPHAPRGDHDLIEIIASNSKYSFSISNSSINRELLISHFSDDPYFKFKGGKKTAIDLYEEQLRTGTIGGVVLKELAIPTIYTIKMPASKPPSEGQFRFEFVRIASAGDGTQGLRILRGHLDVDPMKEWNCCDAVVFRKEGTRTMRYSISNEYTLRNGKYVLIKSKTLGHDIASEDKLEMTSVRTFIDSTVDESQFMLSHYGMPEPLDNAAPNRNSWRRWLLFAAAASAGLAVIFKYSVRSRNSKMHP